MKKLLSILLMMMMVFTFIGCENDAANNATEVNVVVDESKDTKEEVKEEIKEEVKEEVKEETSVYPMTFTDGMGRQVTIESEPMTIVSLAPSMTETIYALGLGDRLIGRTDFCNYPEAALTVESIGSLREPNLESIIALNPDLILLSTHSSEEVVAMFDEAGLNSAVLIAQESFEGVYEIITQTGAIFNVADKATELTSSMKSDVAAVVEAVKDVEKKSVYYVVGMGDKVQYTATGDTFIHDMLQMAGGNNIASDGSSWKYNLESIIQKDPEVVICSEFYDTKATLEQTEGYMSLTAVKEGRLLEIDSNILSIQGPRLAEGLKAIASLLHPELFE